MIRSKHILGPSIPTSEVRVAHVTRSPRFLAFMSLFGLIAALRHPAESLSSTPVTTQVIFWTVAFALFSAAYSVWTIVIFRISMRLGRRTMSETLVMFCVTLQSCALLVPVGALLGVPLDPAEMVRFLVFCFLLFEIGAYIYIAWADRVLFPEVYKDPGPTPLRPPGHEIFFRGTDLPIAELETISARDNGIEVTGLGRTLFVNRVFGGAVAELPIDLGFTIHRSVWVSLKVVGGVRREGRHLLVILPDGRRLPVARSRQKEFENWLDQMGLAID
ncbi:hypothetical protein HKCCSP123_14375 [Rhodobacterales bacterium HKCCSP123]|nr:hypothetical protein [Rhodobacterales bacterium HKCCSP123]